MIKGLRIEASRPDGVVLVNLGERQMVLVNLDDRTKSPTLDILATDKWGPWHPFADTKPSARVREAVAAIVDRRGNLVAPHQIGSLTVDHQSLRRPADLTRVDLREILALARLDADEIMPVEQDFEEDEAFVARCRTEILPAIKQTGVGVNLAEVAAWLHVERTGRYPSFDLAIAAPSEDGDAPGAPSINPAAPQVEKNAWDDTPQMETFADDTTDETTGDPGMGEGTDAPAVAAVEQALDALEVALDALLSSMGATPPAEGFDAADKMSCCQAKLSAVRNFGTPTTPPTIIAPQPIPAPSVMSDVELGESARPAQAIAGPPLPVTKPTPERGGAVSPPKPFTPPPAPDGGGASMPIAGPPKPVVPPTGIDKGGPPKNMGPIPPADQPGVGTGVIGKPNKVLVNAANTGRHRTTGRSTVGKPGFTPGVSKTDGA
jgi:hypothetical protein